MKKNKLKSSWSIEVVEDLQSQLGIDVSEELEKILKKELNKARKATTIQNKINKIFRK